MKFQYKCDGCGLEIEMDKSITAPHPSFCEFCDEDSLYHVINPTTTIYNCGGFYSKEAYTVNQ